MLQKPRKQPDLAPCGGFTLVELLVVIAIIGTLVGLLLPAVQAARESARRSSCQNNLRQFGIALLNFESHQKVFPAANWTKAGPGTPAGKYVGWKAVVLPYVEEANLRDLYDVNLHWWDGENVTAGAKWLELFICPSVSDRMVVTSAIAQPPRPAMTFPEPLAPTDYEAIMGVQTPINPPLYATPATNRSAMFRNSAIKVAHVRDGTTHTIAIIECGARPLTYQGRNPVASIPNNQGQGWIDSEGPFSLDGANSDGTVIGGGPAVAPVAINATNFNEPYSFHRGGASFVFLDGHVEFIDEFVALGTFAAMCTRAAREVIVD
jgi:prepilin-type N-terminal cleavage/methylation domain-containing protein/prepilin-type processing-associated H-X9-DG protein